MRRDGRMLGVNSSDAGTASAFAIITDPQKTRNPSWYIMNPYDKLSQSWNTLSIADGLDEEGEYLAICKLAEWLLIAATKSPVVDDMGYWEYLANPMLRSVILHVRWMAKPAQAELCDVYRACGDLPSIWRKLPLTQVYGLESMMQHLKRYLALSAREQQTVNSVIIAALEPWGAPSRSKRAISG